MAAPGPARACCYNAPSRSDTKSDLKHRKAEMFDIRVAGRLSDTDGGGEEQFKEYLRTALSDDYIAILGAVISASPEDRRNQIDALIIGPPGVFLLDVKNWSGR